MGYRYDFDLVESVHDHLRNNTVRNNTAQRPVCRVFCVRVLLRVVLSSLLWATVHILSQDTHSFFKDAVLSQHC